MNKNILICLNQLDIGGVETAVINQVKVLIEHNCRVVVLAKEGIYSEIVEKLGAIFIDFDFQLMHRI